MNREKALVFNVVSSIGIKIKKILLISFNVLTFSKRVESNTEVQQVGKKVTAVTGAVEYKLPDGDHRSMVIWHFFTKGLQGERGKDEKLYNEEMG